MSSSTTNNNTITLPVWDSRQEPHGWPTLQSKIIDQYMDVICDCPVSVFDAMTFAGD